MTKVTCKFRFTLFHCIFFRFLYSLIINLLYFIFISYCVFSPSILELDHYATHVAISKSWSFGFANSARENLLNYPCCFILKVFFFFFGLTIFFLLWNFRSVLYCFVDDVNGFFVCMYFKDAAVANDQVVILLSFKCLSNFWYWGYFVFTCFFHAKYWIVILSNQFDVQTAFFKFPITNASGNLEHAAFNSTKSYCASGCLNSFKFNWYIWFMISCYLIKFMFTITFLFNKSSSSITCVCAINIIFGDENYTYWCSNIPR